METESPTWSDRIVASSIGVVSFTRAMLRCYRVWYSARVTRHASGFCAAGRTDRCDDGHSRKEARWWWRGRRLGRNELRERERCEKRANCVWLLWRFQQGHLALCQRVAREYEQGKD